MMKHSDNHEFEDDEENAMRTSVNPLINNNQKSKEAAVAPEIPLCGFVSIQYYAPYFDVDTDEIKQRILGAATGFRNDSFLQMIEAKPDLYGPFWIATSLIFLIAVVSHFSSYVFSILNSKADWSYDFQSVVNVASVVYGFIGLVPAGIWFIMNQYASTETKSINLVTSVCVYGYSLLAFVPAVLLMLIPSYILAWVGMLAAAAASALFNVKNFGPTIMMTIPQQHAPIILGALAAIQFLFMLIVKLSFF